MFDPVDANSSYNDLHSKKSHSNYEKDDILWLMESPQGRKFAWKFLENSGVFRLSYSKESLQMAFLEGNRNLGLQFLLNIHNYCPNLYSKMLQEHLMPSVKV